MQARHHGRGAFCDRAPQIIACVPPQAVVNLETADWKKFLRVTIFFIAPPKIFVPSKHTALAPGLNLLTCSNLLDCRF